MPARTIRLSLAVLMLTVAGSSFAAAPPSAPPQAAPAIAREKMKRLAVMVGQWQGDGWIDMGPQGRKTFNVKESIQPRLDGTVLLVEGLGKGRIQPQGPEVPVHQALGVLSYDAQADRYGFVAYRLGGEKVDTEMKALPDGSFQWGFSMPHGQVRFTIRIADGQWVESGERSADGKTFTPFFEMKLKRTEG
ncbi:hypothetical protein FGE12_04500 [Aggregicoccus sp. 17bor-14]|uniref:hypothetical protein n=1 Tax=Myxococcaceae TaxID=31 RepID=UPI00129C3546|nr:MULTISPECIES: hypothetical protein [Myxococcaceae]MBF5041637.1 hypothetical protein [Simulacricoccus sp. 17bor-14]MRI87421.1 hypothetical protein [Aggregicoccus sp. 17bor-14]